MKISGPISPAIISLPGRNSIVHTDLWCRLVFSVHTIATGHLSAVRGVKRMA